MLPTDSTVLNEKIIKFNNYLKNRKDLLFLDVYRLFLDGVTINNIYTTDGIHLTNYGYELLNKEIDRFLEELV